MRFKYNIDLNKIVAIAAVIAVILLIVFWFWWGKKEISIDKVVEGQNVAINNGPVGSVSGINCDNHDSRPVAVMMPSDPITRPLSGIAGADMVFEMPVTPGGVTRIMAVFQCSRPGTLGSIRSAREDFIPLAAGLGAVYVHWGGEREALQKLNNHAIDNIDGLKYENIYFYRKSGIKQPHNGFIDFNKISEAIADLKYDDKNGFSGYPRGILKTPSNIVNIESNILVSYPPPYDVKWIFDPSQNIYSRFRDGTPEIDKSANQQVKASVVIVMKTTSKFINKDYLTVHTAGSGQASVYQSGVKIDGQWEKDPSKLDSKLFFRDLNGKEINFIPGKIWVNVIIEQ